MEACVFVNLDCVSALVYRASVQAKECTKTGLASQTHLLRQSGSLLNSNMTLLCSMECLRC